MRLAVTQFILALAVILLPLGARAAEQPIESAARRLGAEIKLQACSALFMKAGLAYEIAWIKDRADENHRKGAEEMLFLGYLTGASTKNEDDPVTRLGWRISAGKDPATTKAWLRDCGAHVIALQKQGAFRRSETAAAREKAVRHLETGEPQ